MKKISLLIIIVIIFTSCKSEETNAIIGNYYYSKTRSEIFYFNKDKVFKYSILDSIITPIDFELDKDYISLDHINYNYNNFDGDSILIYDYYNSGISLIKFDYKEFDIEVLNNSNWELKYTDNNGISSKKFLKIKNYNGMHFFARVENNDTLYFHKIPYKGKIFDKFHIYYFFTVFIPFNYTNDSLSALTLELDSLSYTNKIVLKKLPISNKVNSLLESRWNRIKGERNSINERTKLEYSYKIDSLLVGKREWSKVKGKQEWVNQATKLKYAYKIDSIEKLLDYNRIEFLNNKLIRHMGKNTVIYEIDNNPVSDYLFVNNPNFNEQFIEIIKLNKDSLTIKISEPSFFYNYVRD